MCFLFLIPFNNKETRCFLSLSSHYWLNTTIWMTPCGKDAAILLPYVLWIYVLLWWYCCASDLYKKIARSHQNRLYSSNPGIKLAKWEPAQVQCSMSSWHIADPRLRSTSENQKAMCTLGKCKCGITCSSTTLKSPEILKKEGLNLNFFFSR